MPGLHPQGRGSTASIYYDRGFGPKTMPGPVRLHRNENFLPELSHTRSFFGPSNLTATLSHKPRASTWAFGTERKHLPGHDGKRHDHRLLAGVPAEVYYSSKARRARTTQQTNTTQSPPAY